MNCKYCYQPLPEGLAEEKRRRKIQCALNMLAKAKARGTKVGRPKIRNDELIWKLRDEKHSIRAIAAMTGVSTTAVQRALKSTPKVEVEE